MNKDTGETRFETRGSIFNQDRSIGMLVGFEIDRNLNREPMIAIIYKNGKGEFAREQCTLSQAVQRLKGKEA